MTGKFLLQDVDEESFLAFTDALESTEGEFLLEIASAGGDTNVMWAFHDKIMCVERKITGVALGYCHSAAPLILAACDTRFCSPKTEFMVHEDIVTEAEGSPDKVMATAVRAQADEEKWYEAMEFLTGTRASVWRTMSRNETYFGATEAKKLGTVDRILPIFRKPRKVAKKYKGRE